MDELDLSAIFAKLQVLDSTGERYAIRETKRSAPGSHLLHENWGQLL